ncbi:MAG: lysylphosphatidylglycerol synthase transmembrane domain-containing protein, partial [Gammaproteobacteria bacterium]
VLTPLGSLGGEPIKAALIRKHCGIGYREGTASLILAQTIVNLALLGILFIGFLLMLITVSLPSSYSLAAGLGMGLFSLAILGFVLVQRAKLLSRAGGWLGRGKLGERARHLLHVVHEVEDRIIAFYTDTPGRLALAVGTSLLHWLVTIVGVYLGLRFLGQPMTLAEAWVLTAMVVLVRSALFVVPAGLGSQDGTFVLITGALTGSAAVGLALALLIRFREMVWILWGLAIGWQLEVRRIDSKGTLNRRLEAGRAGRYNGAWFQIPRASGRLRSRSGATKSCPSPPKDLLQR